MKTICDLGILLKEAESLVYSLDGSGALMAMQQSQGIPDLAKYPELAKAVAEISEIRKTPPLHLMINILKPNVTVPIHRDWILPTKHQSLAPTVERWHLPIKTNPEARYWNELNGVSHMPLGYWSGPIQYWMQHQVWNSGPEERIHIVIDLDTPHALGHYQ